LSLALARNVPKPPATKPVDFSQLQTRVKERLDEPSTPVYWTAAEIKEAINKAQRAFCLLTLAVERTASFNLTANTAFYLISEQIEDFLVPLRVTASGARVLPFTIHELNLSSLVWRTTTGTPTRYAQLGFDLLAISPVPAGAGASLAITYAASPVTLTGNGDMPEIPEEHHPCLIDYAIWWLRAKEGGQEFAKTTDGLKSFLDSAQMYAEFMRARSKGQLYDRQPFDLSSFDRGRLLKVALKPARPKPETGSHCNRRKKKKG